ncbi:MAG: hypothetical protein JWM32_1597 [Verrucomicrobia bacterium]|nr:hypothetical protein [Verrucomicrobiota bacterium]
METDSLHARLLEDARRYDPAEHTRGLLDPYRDVLLLWRVKFMSYEQIAATLTKHGLKVSPAAVGIFCRRKFTKAEILRARADEPLAPRPAASAPTLPGLSPSAASQLSPKRGPKIARDHY